MRIYDLTIGISPGLPVWPGDPPVTLERVKRIAEGANANVSHLACGVHTGTHVDAPVHFIDGAPGIDSLSLKVLTGRVYVIDLRKATVLDAATLEASAIPPRTRRILFKTRNSALWSRQEKEFQTDFVAVEASGAEWLVRKGVQLVGVDYLSVAPYGNSRPTHRILLEAGVAVVEGLNLTQVTQGRYTLYCLPLKLMDCDGAPARVILVGV
jgi:arylformamidase